MFPVGDRVPAIIGTGEPQAPFVTRAGAWAIEIPELVFMLSDFFSDYSTDKIPSHKFVFEFCLFAFENRAKFTTEKWKNSYFMALCEIADQIIRDPQGTGEALARFRPEEKGIYENMISIPGAISALSALSG